MRSGTFLRAFLAIVLAVTLGAAYSDAQAATLTWTGGADGHSWNGDGNWTGGTRPGYYDTLNITTTDTIDRVYRDAGTSIYVDGSTWRGVVNLNQGTITIDHRFESGSSGVFNIGDGSGTADAVVNVTSGGLWKFDRHSNGTYRVNVKSDGELNATGSGYFAPYGGHNNRKWEINVDGGQVTSGSAWNMSDGAGNDANRMNLSNGGTVAVGAISVHEEVIQFLDTTNTSFTANYGGSFPNMGAVDAALGSRFTPPAGRTLAATDNGGSFTVSVAPERHEVAGDNTIGVEALPGTLANATYTPGVDAAKYIRLVQNVSNTFQVAEVQAFETGTGINVAEQGAGGVATAKDSGYGTNPGRANDGNLAQNYPNLWHSSSGQGTWLQIELASATDLDSVYFYGRSDCCHDRQDDFNLIVEDAGHNELFNRQILGLGSAPNQQGSIPLESVASGDLVATLVDMDTYVFELGSQDVLTVDNPDPSMFTTILDLNNATIELELPGGPLAPGSYLFDILDADEIRGTYDQVILPGYADHVWDTSNLLVDGTVGLHVPEPATLGLLGLAACGLGGYVRRRRR